MIPNQVKQTAHKFDKSFRAAIKLNLYQPSSTPILTQPAFMENRGEASQRGQYRRIALTDKLRLTAAFDRGDDHLALAQALGIKRTTAASIVAKHARGEPMEQPRGGRREQRVLVTPEVLVTLIDIVEESPGFTLRQIGSHLFQRSGVQLSTSTISRALDAQLIRIKKLETAPVERNIPRIKVERQVYAEWLLGVDAGARENLLYLDEAGFNLHTVRTRGRARVGERAVRQVLAARGRNLNLILTISARGGIVYYETVVGSVTAEVMAHYFDNLSEVIEEEQAVDLIMDNAPVHNGATMRCNNHRIRKLPAYSPFLNPVENAFSAVKADVKRQLNEPDMQLQIQDRDAARAAGLNLQQHRLQIVNNIVINALEHGDAVTPQKTDSWFQHTYSYLAACVRQDNILM